MIEVEDLKRLLEKGPQVFVVEEMTADSDIPEFAFDTGMLIRVLKIEDHQEHEDVYRMHMTHREFIKYNRKFQLAEWYCSETRRHNITAEKAGEWDQDALNWYVGRLLPLRFAPPELVREATTIASPLEETLKDFIKNTLAESLEVNFQTQQVLWNGMAIKEYNARH